MNVYHTYQAFLTHDEEGGFDVTVPALPGCFTYGEDYEDAGRMAADAIRTYLAALLADGGQVPFLTANSISWWNGGPLIIRICIAYCSALY